MARVASKKYDGVYINKLQNGDTTFYITYKDLSGKKIWLKIGTNKKGSHEFTESYCNIKRNEFVNKLRLGEDPMANKKKNIILFDSIAQEYFLNGEHIQKDIKRSKGRYMLHIKPFIGHKDIFTITCEDIKVIQSEKTKSLAPKTVNIITALAGTIFNYAINYKELNFQNPIANTVKFKKLKVNNARERFLNLEEIRLLLKEISTDTKLDLFVRFSLSTGGRLETVMNIKKKDINMDTNSINLYDFKNNSDYKAFITKDLKELLVKILPNLDINDSVVQYCTNTIQKKLKPILDKLFNEGLDLDDRKNRVVIHTLRHTFASHLAINGTPIYTIQKLMNHKDIKMTLRYTKLAPDSGKDMIAELYI